MEIAVALINLLKSIFDWLAGRSGQAQQATSSIPLTPKPPPLRGRVGSWLLLLGLICLFFSFLVDAFYWMLSKAPTHGPVDWTGGFFTVVGLMLLVSAVKVEAAEQQRQGAQKM